MNLEPVIPFEPIFSETICGKGMDFSDEMGWYSSASLL